MTWFYSIFQHAYTLAAFPFLFCQNMVNASINVFRSLSSVLIVICQLGYKWRILHSVFGTPIAKLAQGLTYRVQHFCNNRSLFIIIFDLFRTSLCPLLRKYRVFSGLLLFTFFFQSSSCLPFLFFLCAGALCFVPDNNADAAQFPSPVFSSLQPPTVLQWSTVEQYQH